MDPLRPTGSDQSLLARLNALKPTSVSLAKTTNITPADASVTAATTSTGQQPEPPSCEDALTARLRILRNTAASAGQSASGTDREPANVDLEKTQPQSQQRFKTASLKTVVSTSSYPSVTRDAAVEEESLDDPYLFETDDLDDLLEGLDSFELEDDLLDGDGENGRHGVSEDRRVSEILETLKPPQSDNLKSQNQNKEEEDDDDDSDGEHMNRDVEKILAQVRDELSIEKQRAEARTPDEASTRDVTTDSSSLALPGAPSSQPVDPAIDEEADDGTCGTAAQRKSRDFENEITTRLASLRGLGSGVNLDSFGLPTAPTFEPENRSASTAASLVTKRGGYTDEDQKTWCIVCLDDATVRCVGCDNDVYCDRCWKDMHFGPSAGYDYRGHQWAKFHR